MAAIEPIVAPVSDSIAPFPDRRSPRSSRLRPILAGLLLVVLGLLAAASVFASRPYRHAPTPAPTTPLYHPNHVVPGQSPDHC